MSAYPMPEGGTIGHITAFDGASLRYAYWPGRDERGTVIFLTGYRESINKHFETIADLKNRGFHVFAMDWRNQGKSSRPLANRQKVYVPDFGAYVKDLHQLISEVVKPTAPGPYRLMAHSMGGHVVLRYLHDYRYDVAGAILCAPMVEIAQPRGVGWLARAIVWLAARLGLAKSYAFAMGDYGPNNRTFEGNELTSDPARFASEHDQIDEDPELATGAATYGWLDAALRSSRLLRRERYLKAITVPVYIVQAGADTVVSNRAQDRIIEHLLHGYLFKVEGAKHEILREKDQYRDQFWAVFDQFVTR